MELLSTLPIFPRFVEMTTRQSPLPFQERPTRPRGCGVARCSFFVLTVTRLLTWAHGIAAAAEPAPVRLTQDGSFKSRPSWSPDGRHVVFTRHRGNQIFLSRLDRESGREDRLTTQTAPEFDAAYAPDGKELLLAFDKTSPNQGDIEVYRLVLADQKLIPAAVNSQGLSHEESPRWAPDGKQFVFTSTRDGNQEIYSSSVTGGAWKRLTQDAAHDAHPAWSPDGRTIAFATNRWGDLEIALIDTEGQNLRRLTSHRGLDDYPCWSPDGRLLAYTSRREGNDEIVVRRLDGAETLVTDNPGIDTQPAWSADGRIVFVSDRDGGFDLYVLAWPAAEIPAKATD